MPAVLMLVSVLAAPPRPTVAPNLSPSPSAVVVAPAAPSPSPSPSPSPGSKAVSELADVVRERERAFAKTMADRDLKAFGTFVAEEAIFMGRGGPLRGRSAVVDGWKRLFEGPKAPFSWEPEKVEALESGTIALSTGPVLDPDGKRIGTFTSTWRLDGDGQWRVVLDGGCPPCACPPAP
jgi:ketosteroid isomerase-like protein